MAVPPPNAGYLVNLTPDDDVVMRDLVIQAWLAEIVSAVNSGGGGGGLSPIAAYSTLANNTAATAVPVASQFLTLGTPSITDTGVELQLTGSTNGYLQSILQNTSSGAAASADYIVNNNSGTATTFYGDFGMNSSTFTGTGSLNLANAVYLYSESVDLVVGTNTLNAVHFVTNGGATDVLTLGSGSFALPVGATTSGAALTIPTQTYTLTGTNTAVAYQAMYHGVATFTNAAAGAVTDLFNTVFAGPTAVAGSQTATRLHTLGVLDSTSAATSITGAFVVATAFGTSATSVGIGGGNVAAGGTVSSGTSLFTSGTLSVSTTSTLLGGVGIGTAVVANQILTIVPAVRTSGILPYIKWTIPADTGQTASTESPGLLTVTGTRTWATGALALQRENLFVGATYAFAAASTLSDAFTVGITPALQGTNATITRPHSLGILDSNSASSSITGGLIVATAFGTSATSVGIGGGNINAGGTVTAGGLVTASAGITVGGATYAGTVVLTAGAGTITSAAITTSSVIVLTLKTASGANAYPQILANAGTATITGLGTDAGTYNWRLIT